MTSTLSRRMAEIDWAEVAEKLDEQGWCRLRGVMEPGSCRRLVSLYDSDDRFRKTVGMLQHRFGEGDYRYFRYPLPIPVGQLRRGFYKGLVPIANAWAERLERPFRYPGTLKAYTDKCHGVGQCRPTPLMLRYEAGGYNRMHQDLYGPEAFPLQVVIPLSQAGGDFDGGEFLLSEQAPRMQSRVSVVTPRMGDAVIFPNAERPSVGRRGDYRVNVRHGASTITRGHRFALGLIFHDAA